MIKVRDFAAVLALGALAALPGCSLFGGGGNEAQTTAAAAPAPAPAPAPMPAPAPTGSSADENQMSHSTVRQVQQKLKQGRMYSGRVDGMWGPMTRRGVMRFQQANNLQANGELDDATLQAMNISPAGGGGNMGGGNMGGGNMGGSSGGAMNDTSGGTDMSTGSSGSMNGGMSGNSTDMSGTSSGGTSSSGTGGTAAPAR